MARTDVVRSPSGPTLLVSIVTIAALCTLVVMQALTDRREVLNGAHEEVANLGEALAEHTRQAIATVDLGLSTLAREVSERGGLSTLSQIALHELLLERQAVSPATHVFFVLDSEGRLIGTSARAFIPPASFADTPNHIHHREQPGSDLFISPPSRGRLGKVANLWVVTVSMRLDEVDGSFAGTVAALVSLDHLLSFYETLRIGNDGVVALLAADGTLITQSPLAESLIGKPLFEAEQMQRVLDNGKYQLAAEFPADGIRRIAGFHAVADRQLVVLVAIGEDDALANWRRRLSFNLIIALAVIVMFISASSLFARHLARRRLWEEDRARRLRHLAEASVELAQARDENELRTLVTRFAREQVDAWHAVTSVLCPGAAGGYLHSFAPDEQAAPPSRKASAEADPLAKDMHAGAQAFVLPSPQGKGSECLIAPVLGQSGVPLAVIRLLALPGRKFSEVDVAEITQLANFTAVALENLRAVQHREAAVLKLETVFSSISDGVVAVDADWRYTYVNAEAERLLQRPRDELLGQNMWEAFPESTQSPVFQLYRQARDENRPGTAEFYYPPLKRWFSVRAYPHEQGLTIYFQDITQRIEIEQQLRHAQKMDAIGKLTGGVAHDFNNLLTVILGNANAALEWADGAELAPTARRQIELIRVAGECAAELTHRLLAFARPQPLDPVPTDVNRLLSEFDELLRRTLGPGIKIELRLQDDVWPAVVDRHELQNAILNLAINARDAMPDGGVLGISSANVTITEHDAALFDLPAGGYVMVEVSDTGEGMPPEVVSRACEPFFTTKPAGKGSGLGLSMVYGFAKQSGGQVQIVSSPGAGSTLRIYLPRAVESAAGSVLHAARVASPSIQRDLAGSGQHVLLVEDDDLVRIHTDACLQQLGYSVTACADGAQAMEYLHHGGPCDVLVTDVRLQNGASGREVAESARKRSPHIKVLYVSGFTQDAFLQDEPVEVDICLLGKPFRTEDLARKLRELLSN